MPSFVDKIGGKERTFQLLSVDDFKTLGNSIPNPSSDVIDLRSLDRWSKSPEGCEWFIWQSLRKSDPIVTREDVRKMGSVMHRVTLASEIFTRSIGEGEEPESPKVEGGQPNPPTGT